MPDIKKLDLNHPDTKSADIVAGNIEALKALFPDAFTEGKIDFDYEITLLTVRSLRDGAVRGAAAGGAFSRAAG